TRNLDYLHTHPALRPFFESGVLDVARFDVESDREVRLLHSGEVLAPGSVCGPLVVVANYVFDSVRQDAFRVSGGRLFESLLPAASAPAAPDTDDETLLSQAELKYDEWPVDDPYYDDPIWNRILEDYRDRLPDTCFLFPTAALRCIEALRVLSGGPMLLLSG